MKLKVMGNRIPYEYFITTGGGESEAGSKGLPFETGSYDAALNDAGIEDVNVVKYTSVLPTGAKQIKRETGLKGIQWGEVMECIMAQANGNKGATITAAVMTTEVKDPKGKHMGGFACEYSGSGGKKDVEESLGASITGMIKRRGYGTFHNKIQMYKDNKTTKGYTIHPGKVLAFKSLGVKEAHGTVLASICFTSYKFPMTTRVGRTVSANHGGSRRKVRKRRKTRRRRR
jgi:pyruvoyl-dependent arginine decarboxylase